MKSSKQCLIVYPELNLFDPNRAGGIDHLLANIRGYNYHGYRCIIICSINWRIIYRDKNNNLYINVISNISKTEVPSKIAFSNIFTYIVNYLKYILKKNMIIAYSIFAKLIVKLVKPVIVHERSTNKFNFHSLSKLQLKYVYEINDYQYRDMPLFNSDIVLVTKKQYYPVGPKYYSRPWPVNIKGPKLNVARFDRKIVYMGSLIELHSLNLMKIILEELNKKEPWEVHVYGPPKKAHSIKHMKYFRYRGYVKSENISLTLSSYMFGFSLYAKNRDMNRLNVGSPSKNIQYLMSGVVPITNLINDKELENIYGRHIINIDQYSIKGVVSKVLSIQKNYRELSIDTEWIVKKYHPENYYSKLLKMIDQ